jgi:hypothetical protein
VAYYNVADPAAPSELGRVVLGPPGSFTDSDAIYDEKAFKIVDELGLIAIPFHHFEGGGGTPVPVPLGGGEPASAESSDVPKCTNGVQLVDFSDTALTRRGAFEHRGRVERVGVVGGRIFALSQAAFQTVHMDDRDNPAKAGQADFFTGEDMSYYADDCGGYWGPIDLVVNEDPWGNFLASLFGGGLCGALGALPILMIPAGLAAGRLLRRRRT